MIPNIDILTQPITEVEYPNRTYKININFSENEDRIAGYTDDLDAVKQAIYLILNTERYDFPIYSWDYGIELVDLIGKPMPYVMAEIPRRVEDALLQDDRIKDVRNFEFEVNKRKLHVTFEVVTKYEAFTTGMDVDVVSEVNRNGL